MVFLPGTGCTAEWAATETRLLDAAPAAGFVLVIPEAQRPDPASPAKFLTNPPRWNDGSPAALPELQTHADDVAFLHTVLDHLLAHHAVDRRRVFLAGFSNGAGMAFRYAAHAAGRIAALAAIAGLWYPDGVTPGRPLPTFHLNGTQDPLIPYRGGEVRVPWGNRILKRPAVTPMLEAWAAAIGCAPRSEIVYDDGSVRDEVYPGPVAFRSVTVTGLGHHWPGGRGELNTRIAGPVNHAYDLNPALFDFFHRAPPNDPNDYHSQAGHSSRIEH
jgi:polyhydroxybutyrate depolymerase